MWDALSINNHCHHTSVQASIINWHFHWFLHFQFVIFKYCAWKRGRWERFKMSSHLISCLYLFHLLPSYFDVLEIQSAISMIKLFFPVVKAKKMRWSQAHWTCALAAKLPIGFTFFRLTQSLPTHLPLYTSFSIRFFELQSSINCRLSCSSLNCIYNIYKFYISFSVIPSYHPLVQVVIEIIGWQLWSMVDVQTLFKLNVHKSIVFVYNLNIFLLILAIKNDFFQLSFTFTILFSVFFIFILLFVDLICKCWTRSTRNTKLNKIDIILQLSLPPSSIAITTTISVDYGSLLFFFFVGQQYQILYFTR